MSDRISTLARAWVLERRDGLTLGFTDHDRDLAFEGLAFRARSGMTASALVQSTGLSVDNTEALGALSDAGLAEADILAGRWDGAGVRIWEVDWSRPGVRRLLFRGTLGEIARAGGAFRAELRGLAEPLGQGRGRVFGAACPAVLGDGQCGVDLDAPGFHVEADLIAVSEGGAILDLPPMQDFEIGWFAEGRLRFLSGAAAGLGGYVRHERAEGAVRQISLWQAPGALPAPGDRLRLEAGCDKRFQTCRLKFANQINFRGFPHVPAADWLMAAPKGDGRDDGGRRA